MEGLIPFVYGVIKRRRKRPGRSYERLRSSGAAATRGAREHFAGAGAYHSQSCRFPVRPTANELELSHYDGDCRRASREVLSGELSCSPAGRNEQRRLSRSLRFSSMRMLACVSGA